MPKKQVRNTIIIDETGDLGKNTGSRVYGVGAVIIKNPERLEAIAKNKRKELKLTELKYTNPELTKEENELLRAEMADLLSKEDFNVRGVYVKKSKTDNPSWWSKEKHRGDIEIIMIKELTDDLIESGELDGSIVIIDNSATVKNNTGKIAMEKRALGKATAKITQEDSEAGDNRDIMQASDFLIGEMGRQAAFSESRMKPATLRRLFKR